MKDKKAVIKLILAEVEKAEKKFPHFPSDIVHGAAIMGEEAGEALAAALDFYYRREDDIKPLITEVAHTGAMAVRFLLRLIKEYE